jgi:xanthine dehydrogenase accessory factor
MRDVFPAMKILANEGRRFALARVVATWGSAPRRPGSAMVIAEGGQVAGSVSGGCIESDVITAALASLHDGERRLCTFGVESAKAWSVGLSCGGSVSVLVQSFDPESRNGRMWMAGLAEGRGLKIITELEGTGETVDTPVCAGAETTGLQEIDGHRVFVHVIPRPDRLLIIGGADIAVHLTAMASRLDFEVTVVDPRAVFSDVERFDVPPARIETAWPQEVLGAFDPDEETYAVLLTHEPRIDDAALHILLRSPARYIGALGGRKTQDSRLSRLKQSGFSPADIARVRGPVGISIGASSPSEIAVSILAEIVAVRNGRS